jgi:hypothetical protein
MTNRKLAFIVKDQEPLVLNADETGSTRLSVYEENAGLAQYLWSTSSND